MSATDIDPIEPTFVFSEDRLPERGIFKVPEFASTDTFCVERDSGSDSFRERVSRLGLKGVGFSQVWSSDAGSTPYDSLAFLND